MAKTRRAINPADVELLRRALERSGRTLDEFAREELLRDGRTIRYWLNGEYPIPALIIPRLQKLARRRPKKGRIVAKFLRQGEG